MKINNVRIQKMIKLSTRYIFYVNGYINYTWYLYSCIFSTTKIKFLKFKVKLRLINKMFKLKKYTHVLKPLIHLSSFYYTILSVKLKFRKKKKILKLFFKNNKIIPNLKFFIKKRLIDKYTGRGLFLKSNLFLKKKR